MLSVAATYVFTMVLPYIKIGDVGSKLPNTTVPETLSKTKEEQDQTSHPFLTKDSSISLAWMEAPEEVSCKLYGDNQRILGIETSQIVKI